MRDLGHLRRAVPYGQYARRLFGERGYADVGTEEIVRSAGLTRGARRPARRFALLDASSVLGWER